MTKKRAPITADDLVVRLAVGESTKRPRGMSQDAWDALMEEACKKLAARIKARKKKLKA